MQTPRRRREAATCARSARAEGPVAPRGFARVPVVGPNRCATLRRPSGLSAGDTLFGAFWGRFGPVLGLTGHSPWQAMARGVWYLVQAAAVAAAVVGATNVQVGALVSTASLEHSNILIK